VRAVRSRDEAGRSPANGGDSKEERALNLPPQVQEELLARMRRIEGQARGVQRMLIEDRDCLDILTQLASLRSAAYGASIALTEHYAAHCFLDASRHTAPEDAVRSLINVLLRAPH